MNGDFKETASNRSLFHKTYIEALRAIMACDDEKANGCISAARTLLGKSSNEDEAVQRVKDELNSTLLVRMGGDYNYGYARVYPYEKLESFVAGPWIKDSALMDMIGRHVAVLGDENDVATFHAFVQKSSKYFDKPYGLSSSPDLMIA
jgi:hypothetical protein